MADNEIGIDVERSAQVEKITPEDFANYIVAKKCSLPCAACGADRWDIPQYNDRPEILMMPSARDPRTADWFFQMICGSCGSSRFIGASFVWKYVYKKDEGEK